MDYSNWIVPFGKYKFTALCRVPPNWLLNIRGQRKVMEEYPEMKAYIKANLDSLKQNKGKFEMPETPVLPCKKISFMDEKAAKLQLKIVREDQRDHKKPIRAYECEKCGYWHLTSKPLILPKH